MNVSWIKCNNDNWCRLKTVNLDNVTTRGVYTIGHQSSATIHTVYVGQGDVAERLEDHRSGDNETSKAILEYEEKGTLYATWASIGVLDRDGVERYVADKLKPLVGSRHPDVDSIEVNLPQGWI